MYFAPPNLKTWLWVWFQAQIDLLSCSITGASPLLSMFQ